MDCRQRRSATRREVVRQSDHRGPRQSCRTTHLSWYGILFFAVAAAGGCTTSQASPSVPERITISFPEGTGIQADRGAGQVARSLAVEGLTLLAPDGRPTPRLASEWKWLDDLTLQVTMLPGLTLHNGEKLDATRAADILRDFASKADRRSSFPGLTDIVSIKATSPTELVFSLKQHSWWLPEDLSIPLEEGRDVGTGPYQVVDRSDANVTLRRFDAYHGGRPGISEITVKTDSTLRTAWASLLRGEADVVVDLPQDTVELIRNDSVRIIAFPRPYQYVIAFNLRLPKFADARIRRALNMAINRESIVQNVLKGSGAPSTGPIWHRHWAADSSGAAVPFAPRRAEGLLQEAGLKVVPSRDQRLAPARLRLTCLVPEGFIVYEHLALEVQRQLSDVGVDIRFDVQSLETYEQRLAAHDFETVMVDITSGFGLSRSSIFWRSPRRAETRDTFAYENPETESLFEQLRAATNDGTVRSVTHRLQEAFRRNPPAIFLAWNERARTFRGDFEIKSQPGTDPLPRLWEWGAQLSDRTAAR